MRGSRRDWDAIVVGLGGIGSGALYWLARELRGDVLGLEQFELGHERGASQDVSRIIRYSYHRAHYVRLARRAYEAWRTVEEESRESLVVPVGGLDLFPEGGAIPLDDYTSSLDAESIPYELLEAAQVVARWPAFRLEPTVRGLYQADGGLLRAAQANAAHASLAREYGAQVRERGEVSALRSKGGEIDLVADGVRYRCAKLVIACGAWSNELLRHFGVCLPLTVTQEQVVYWQPAETALLRENRFPIWIWMDDPCFYGFPTYGEPGPKAAQDVGGEETTPADRTFDRDEAAYQRLTDFLGAHLPGMVGPPIYTKTCLYTLTPDRDFVVDRLPDASNVLVALGAAHAFKYASVLGRVLAELAIDGATPSSADIGRFRIDRPILLEREPATSFMV